MGPWSFLLLFSKSVLKILINRTFPWYIVLHTNKTNAGNDYLARCMASADWKEFATSRLRMKFEGFVSLVGAVLALFFFKPTVFWSKREPEIWKQLGNKRKAAFLKGGLWRPNKKIRFNKTTERKCAAYHECTPATNPSGLFKIWTHAHPAAKHFYL